MLTNFSDRAEQIFDKESYGIFKVLRSSQVTFFQNYLKTKKLFKTPVSLTKNINNTYCGKYMANSLLKCLVVKKNSQLIQTLSG